MPFDPSLAASAAHSSGANSSAISGVVDDQHLMIIAQLINDVAAHFITQSIGSPSTASHKRLHPIGLFMTGLLRHQPAGLMLNTR